MKWHHVLMNDAKEARIEVAMETLDAAESYHSQLVAAKYAALGKPVGSHVPELLADAELKASYERVETARYLYDCACAGL